MFELSGWYRERLGTRIAALEAARRRMKTNSDESIESIRRIAHSLRGSGATYGFPLITEAAGELEKAGRDEIPAKMETLLAALREAASKGRTGNAEILIVEDDRDQADFMKALVSGPDREVYVAATAAQAMDILAQKSISLIVLDLILPDTDGRNLLLRLRERPATAGIPVIVVTVKGAAEAMDECMALGANGFLEKPVNPAALAAAVAGRLAAGSDLAEASRRDPLTGLPNRAAFHEVHGRLRHSFGTEGTPLTLALADIDGLRGINDSFGRAAGDQVLRRAAAVISSSLRRSDYVARWGGGTFAVLFPATDAEGAARALEKARRAIKNERIAVGGRRAVKVTFSAGVVRLPGHLTLEEALLRADGLLFRAKAGGRDRVETDSRKCPATARVMLVEDDELMAMLVRHHLEKEGFEVRHFTNGADALAAALKEQISLIVSDANMPRMDGFELLQRIRAVPCMARLPFVMVTSMGGEDDIARGFELGADDYILKPFSMADLLTRIRRLLRRG